MNDSAVAANPARDATHWFFVSMAGACVFVAFAGFAPTYWLQLPAGTFVWRARGRPHPAYLLGGASTVAVQLLRGPISTTQWWYGIADVLARFGG